MIDGRVDLSTPMGNVSATGGEQVVVEPEQSPRKTPMLNPESVIQWTLYYPGILDTSELQWTEGVPPEIWKATLNAFKVAFQISGGTPSVHCSSDVSSIPG